MTFLRDASIRRKLVAIVMTTTVVALTFTSVALLVYDSYMVRSSLVKERQMLADILGSNSTAALIFGDQAAAEETLAALRAEPEVVAATVYDRSSQEFATYLREPGAPYTAPPPVPGLTEFSTERLRVFQPIVLDGRAIGSVYIESDLNNLYARIRRYLLMTLGIMAFGSFVAFLLLSRIEGILSGPILDVVRTARRVSEHKDYGGRARKYGQDEIGELVDAFNEMLDRVEERDGEIRRARDAAEAANRAKSEFLATMSHELRTPLNCIIGYSEMLRDEVHQEQRDDLVPDLEQIRTSAGDLLELINDVLDLSKIEAGRLDLVVDDFLLGELVEGIADSLRPLAARRGNTLRVHLASGTAELVMTSDSAKVAQCLRNLLSNACKFTENGTIDVRVALDPAHAGLVTIATADTGIGMPAKQLETIFDAFVQGDSSTSRRYGGTGLGLTITRRLCHQLGGDVDVVSEEGVGSTFTLRLPVRVAVSEVPAPAVPIPDSSFQTL